MKLNTSIAMATVISTMAACAAEQCPQCQVSVAKWKNNAKSAVTLFYDDGCPTARTVVIPTLLKYKVPGTFYLMLGYLKEDDRQSWAELSKNPEVTIGNHTLHHSGARDTEHLAEQVGQADPILREITGFSKESLVSFAKPGGVPWKVSQEELKAELDKYNSILRNDFLIAWTDKPEPSFIHNADEAIKNVLDSAIASGERKSLLCHGVGGDWLSFDGAEHEKFIAELKKRMESNQLWCAPEIVVHKYETERAAASVSTVTKSEDCCSFTLTVETGALYDEPLTLVANVKKSAKQIEWYSKNAAGSATEPAKVVVNDGVAVFNVPPVTSTIFIRPVN